MNELFEKEGQSIFTFQKGDIIIRVKPCATVKSVYNDNLGITTEVVESLSNSYRRPYEFVCIENNLIYLRAIKPDYFGKKRISTLYLDVWYNDWALFVLPDGLTMDECSDD